MVLKPRRRPIRKAMAVLAATTGIVWASMAPAHDDAEQHAFSEADIPPEILRLLHHTHSEQGGGSAAHVEELGHGGREHHDE